MQASFHGELEKHVKKALSGFINAFFRKLKEGGTFHPVQQHIIIAQIPHKEEQLNVPILVHVRWLGGRDFGFLAHTIVGDDGIKELARKIFEEERKISREIVHRERGRLSIVWGSAGLRAVHEVIEASVKTRNSDIHLVRPDSRPFLAALYVLQRKRDVEAPLCIYAADRRNKVFWFYVPDEKVHTYNGERGELHFGLCPHPFIELTHTKKPIVVARKAVINA